MGIYHSKSSSPLIAAPWVIVELTTKAGHEPTNVQAV
jgi:hypothetical protein